MWASVHRALASPLWMRLWVLMQVKPVVSGARFHITFHVNPPQNQLPVLFRGHDCFLFTSTYEAWGMPVLEVRANFRCFLAARSPRVVYTRVLAGDGKRRTSGDLAVPRCQRILHPRRERIDWAQSRCNPLGALGITCAPRSCCALCRRWCGCGALDRSRASLRAQRSWLGI